VIRLHLLSLVCFAMLLLSCSGDRIAGSKGGSETTNGITACIRLSDGTPAAGSIVRLRRADFVSRPAVLAKSKLSSADIVTDSKGVFTIRDIDPGKYSIEVNDTSSSEGKGGAVRLSCSLEAEGVKDIGTDYLKPYASVAGYVNADVTNGRELIVQVRGLDRLAIVNEQGSFSFSDLPEGNYEFVIADGSNIPGTGQTVVNVKANAGETVTVNVAGVFRDSGYIVLNSGAAGIASNAVIEDFPLLVRLDGSNFDFSQALPLGEDIRFTKIDGTSLSYEIEQWDTISKVASIWLQIDTILGSRVEQRFVMKWGDTTAHSRSSGEDVFGPSAGFAGVWHLHENPGEGSNSIKDRSGNGFNGTPEGVMTPTNSVNGMVGNAIMFDGNDDHITAGKLNIAEKYSLSCWVYANDLTEAARRFIWKEYSYTLWYDAQGKGVRVEHFTLQDSVIVWRGIYQDNSRMIPLNAAMWYHLTGTYDGDKIRLYINGELADSTRSIGKYPVSSNEPLSIGGRDGEYVKGIMDEVRIEKQARSADWIKLCYVTQMKENKIVTFER
jgi:Concanavalin A-like lectin/glucanases superfamily/Domain of unknown function (DUF2341)